MDHRSSIFPTPRLKRYPWWVLPGLLVLLFAFVGMGLPSSVPKAHAFKLCPNVETSCPSVRAHVHTLTHTKTIKQVMAALPARVHESAYFTAKSINPVLVQKTHASHRIRALIGTMIAQRPLQKHALLRVLAPPPVYQGGERVSYSLVVTNDSAAGPVLAGDTITITDPIPVGLTGLTASANSDWVVSLGATTSPTTLTATYVGTYPIPSGATLSTITITGTLTSSSVPTLTNTATVVTPNDGNTTNNSGTSTIPVVAQPDLAVTETVPTGATFQVGHPADITISVSNVSTTGSVLAGSPITVTSAIPAGLTGLTTTPNSDWTVTFNSTTSPTTMTATYVGSKPVAPGTTLSPIVLHGTLTTPAAPSLTNPATVSTPYDSNPANDSTSITLPVVPQPDMTITETVPTGTTFQVGHTVDFTITATDLSTAGPVLAGDPITITSAIPAGLTGLTTAANSNWTVTFNSTTSPTTMTATYTGTMPVAPGTSLPPIVLTGTLTTAASPSLTNPVTVHTPNDSNAANDNASVTITVAPQPDMTITETVPSGTFLVGHPVDFTITATNLSTAGPVIAGDPITITSAIPAGLTGLTTTSNSNWTVTFDKTTSPATMTATYTGTMPVAPGTSLPPIVLHGTLTAAATPSLTNPVTVHTPNDSNAANDNASVTITVTPEPDMTITETVPTGTTFQVGHTVDFTITASDLSTASPIQSGNPITITSAIPAGLTGLTTTPNSDWTVTFDTTTGPATMTATYVGAYPVATGTSLSPIVLHGTLTAAAPPTLTNPVTVHTPNDSDATNDNASVTITVVPQPDMTITETVPTGTTFQVGHTVDFTITATDLSTAGPVIAGDPITITSAIPAGLTGLTTTANSNWTITFDSTTSPATMTATYTGTMPVAPGTLLPPIVLTGTLTTAASPSLTNPVTVHTPNDSNAANDNASVTITVVPQPDMAVTETVPTGTTFQVGHPVTFTISTTDVSTAGPVLTGDPITITSAIPTGLSNLKVGANSDWLITLNSITSPTTMTATYVGTSPVNPGTTLSPITITGTLMPTASPTLTNPATVSTPNDSNAANDTTSVTITVLPQPDLSLSKTVQPVPLVQKGQSVPQSQNGQHIPMLQKGQRVDYTIEVSNVSSAGPVMPGSPIVVTDNIPAGLTDLTTSSNSDWQVKLSNTTSPTVLTATYIGPYPVTKGTRLAAITLRGTLTGEVVQLTNIATVSTPNDDTASKNKHTGSTTVAIPVDIALAKWHLGPDTFSTGQTVQYQLQVHSTPKSEVIPARTPIHVIDALPAGFDRVHASGTNWKITFSQSGKVITVTALYVGPYPIAHGTWLPPITISARARGKAGRIVNTAIVTMPYDHDTRNNKASDAINLHVPSLPPTGSDPRASLTRQHALLRGRLRK